MYKILLCVQRHVKLHTTKFPFHCCCLCNPLEPHPPLWLKDMSDIFGSCVCARGDILMTQRCSQLFLAT